MLLSRFMCVVMTSAIYLLPNCFARNKIHPIPDENAEEQKAESLEAHLKPLGSVGPYFELYTTEGFPSTRDFFNKYVIPSTPVLMKNAARDSPAFTKWSDSYLINHADSQKSIVKVEKQKKDEGNTATLSMTLRQFVEKYNTTDMYMVDCLPRHLRGDVNLPPMIRCEPVLENVVDVDVWFSNGGTKSLLHMDPVDNINCLYRGNKTVVFLNPHDDPEMWDRVIDVKDYNYSSLDVDAVDLSKFPDLSKARYAKMDVHAGDCFYIPYRWYHQVNSFGSSLAINIWWDHESARFFDLDEVKCGDCSGKNTIADITWPGMCGGENGTTRGPEKEKTAVQAHGKFSQSFSDEESSINHEASRLHGNDPEQPQENTSDQVNKSETEIKKESLTDAIYAAVRRLKTPVRITGIKKYTLKRMYVHTKVWNDRCQEILVNYFGKMDLNKDDVITVDDVELFLGADENALSTIHDASDFFQESLKTALKEAETDRSKELVVELVERGEIDKEQVATIFGNKLKMALPEMTKEEL